MNTPMQGTALPRPTSITPPAPLPSAPPSAAAGPDQMHPQDLQAILQLLMMLLGGQGQQGAGAPPMPGAGMPPMPAGPMPGPPMAGPPAGGMAAMMPGLMGGR